MSNLMIPVSEFMDRWHQMEQTRLQLEHLVRCGRDAIMEFFKLRPYDMTWDSFDMTIGNNPVGDRWNEVIFNGHYYYGGGGEPESESWIVPLETVLKGRQVVLDYFAAEKVKEEAKARELGRQREQREIDKRRAEFLKLKAEFEPAPPENTIVKSDASSI